VRLAEATGRAIATPAEARAMIGLPPRDGSITARTATVEAIRLSKNLALAPQSV
jgi:hypothetical protein